MYHTKTEILRPLSASPAQKEPLLNRRSILFSCIASALYLLISATLIGFKTDQLVLIAIFNTCYFASAVTRKLIIGFSVFIVFWIIFDYMKAFPNYHYNTVSIGQLYQAEKNIFWNSCR